ncbi:FAD-dependent thymidylate synthase [Microbispora cellulosiformans]|uniref:FAD-dependent thymidylate synthase n=1 Tax=Microbispora cellulosiformans TaxID=2614688 RepID=A0A5J5K9A3_9ACTN|nr:FAD-dependent thymidylate synthase [Microbispora cellulosiformans]
MTPFRLGPSELGNSPVVSRPRFTPRRDRADLHSDVIKSATLRVQSQVERVSFSFVLRDISRVASHELVRHRPGSRPPPV